MEQYVLHVTRLCNLRCIYCYETDRLTQYTVDEILETCKVISNNNNEEYSVEFIGGEPLLALENIKVAYDFFTNHATDTGKRIWFVISTNLVLYSDEFIEFLQSKRNIRISVSLDGNSFMNQLRVYSNKAGSYNQVVSNIKKHIELFGSDSMGVHMTATPYNVASLSLGIEHIYNLGVKSIAVGIVESTILLGSEFISCYIREMNEVSKSIMDGKYPNAHISELENLKPVNDQRTYVYDDVGKIIFESYGRSKDDAITRDEVKAVKVSGDAKIIVDHCRRIVYSCHQNRLENKDCTEKEVLYERAFDDEITIHTEILPGNVFIQNIGEIIVISSDQNYGEKILLEKKVVKKIFKPNEDILLTYKDKNISTVGLSTTGLGLSQVESIYDSISKFITQRVIEYEDLFPTFSYKDEVTEFYNREGYSVWIKDLSFGIYPCIGIVVKHDKMDQYKFIISSNYDISLAIKNGLSNIPLARKSVYNLDHMMKGKVVPVKNNYRNHKAEISNLFLIENLECYGATINRRGIDLFISSVNNKFYKG